MIALVVVLYFLSTLLISIGVGTLLGRQSARYAALAERVIDSGLVEREQYQRALLARTPTEYAQMDRVHGEVQRKLAEAERAQQERVVQMTPDEYAEFLRDDFERQGIDPQLLNGTLPVLEGV